MSWTRRLPGGYGMLTTVNSELITYVLTALMALVVVLTRVRLGGGASDGVSGGAGGGAGRLVIPRGLLNAHTLTGVVGVLTWVGFLVTDRLMVGWAGLAILWLTVIAGLMILMRWMPARGRHSSGPVADSWGEGPGLSILAHVGVLAGAVVFTVFMVLDKLG